MIMIPLGKVKRPLVPLVLAPCVCAGSRRRVRSDRRCGRRDRAPHRRSSANRTRQAAVIVDGVVSHVTVTDPHHALSGQRLSLVSLHSARGPTFLVVELGDGRRRSIRRLVTDLGTPSSVSPPRASDLPRISARTLLPLARLLTATLASSARVPLPCVPGPIPPRTCPLSSFHSNSGPPAAALADPAGRDAS